MPRDTRPSSIHRFLTNPQFQGVVLILSFFLNVPAHAEIYKWVDKAGVQHYSEQPPAAGVKYETVNPHYAAPESSSEASVKEEQQSDQNQADQERQQQEQQQQQQQKAEVARVRQENCINVQKHLEDLQSASRITLKNPEGTVQRLTEEERQAKITEAQELIKKYCD